MNPNRGFCVCYHKPEGLPESNFFSQKNYRMTQFQAHHKDFSDPSKYFYIPQPDGDNQSTENPSTFTVPKAIAHEAVEAYTAAICS